LELGPKGLCKHLALSFRVDSVDTQPKIVAGWAIPSPGPEQREILGLNREGSVLGEERFQCLSLAKDA